MKTNELGHNNAVPHGNADSASNRREQLHEQIEALSDAKTRRAVVSIEQMHLSYYK